MKKLSPPSIDFTTALEQSISGIGDEATRNRHVAAFADPSGIETNYRTHATAGTLYSQPRIAASDDPVVCGTLRKSELTKLYSQYFVPESKPARQLYEALKITSSGKCPLCGEVGHVRTLDHYLPKSNFPLYSVLPLNLVPCCRDCNSEKLNAFSTNQEGQTLHPYFDSEKFFAEKWVDARVVRTSPPVIEYLVSPPAGWPNGDKLRVQAHFTEYGLGSKFSTEAAADLAETIHTRRTTMAANSPEEFASYLAERSNNASLPINNWRRVMFAALSSDEWFCSQDFAVP
jgi:hypothetical protein